MGAGDGKVTNAVRLGCTFHEVLVQSFGCILYGLRLATGIIGGKFAFPFPTVLADTGGLQVVVNKAEGVCTQNDVAHHTAIGAVGIGDEASARKRITAEYRNGKDTMNGVVCRNKGVRPLGEGTTQAVYREVFVVAKLLKTEHIYILLLHILSYFLAGIAGNFTPETMDVVGGYGEVIAGFAFLI